MQGKPFLAWAHEGLGGLGLLVEDRGYMIRIKAAIQKFLRHLRDNLWRIASG
jgi:hypothetical protein